MKFMFKIIWDLSEFLNIPLGKFAPFIFGKMINKKGNKIIDTRLVIEDCSLSPECPCNDCQDENIKID